MEISLSHMCKFGFNQCLRCKSIDIDTSGEFAKCNKCGSLRVKNHPGIPGFGESEKPKVLTTQEHNAFPKGRWG